MQETLQQCQKESYSPKTVAEMTDTRLPTIYEALRSKRLKGRRIGQRIIILHDDLMEWLNSLPEYDAPMGPRTKEARQAQAAMEKGFA